MYLGDHEYICAVEVSGSSSDSRLALKCSLICSGYPTVHTACASEFFELEASGVAEEPHAEVG